GLASPVIYAENWYPFVNWRPGDLLGPGMLGEPCGAVKAELGWRRYLTLHPVPGERIELKVNNTEIDNTRIVRIPLGFVLDVGHNQSPQLPHHPGENWILVKSLVAELRTSRPIGLNGTSSWTAVRDPGVRLYYDYEALSGIWYGYRAPFTEFYTLNASYGGLTPPYFSLQNSSSVPGYEQYRIANYTSPELQLELLSENWSQEVIQSSTLTLTVSDSSPPLDYTLSASFYNVDDEALVVQVITHIMDGHKVSYGFGAPVEFKHISLKNDTQIDYYVIFGEDFTGDQDGFARNLLTSAFGAMESHLSYAYGVLNSSQRMVEFTIHNNVNSEQVSIPNYLNLADLEVSASDIQISDSRPGEGDSIAFQATVHNRGGADAEQVSVYLTADRGEVGNGSSPAAEWLLPEIEAKSSAIVEGTWYTTGHLGDNYLVLHVDPGGSLVEIDESNNEASIQVYVLVPSHLTISLDPPFLTTGQFATVSGRLSPARNGTQVRVWYERPDGSRFFEVVYTAEDGSFVDTVRPDIAGRWTVNASCPGDQKHSHADSEAIEFLVGESTTMSTTTTRSVTLTEKTTTATATTEQAQENGSQAISGEGLIIVVIIIVGALAAAVVGFSRALRGST
ncbi:MAG: CARDB domain-containing protein, partial [Nitrososphaeria archaeon]